jgi:hypothetical protein
MDHFPYQDFKGKKAVLIPLEDIVLTTEMVKFLTDLGQDISKFDKYHLSNFPINKKKIESIIRHLENNEDLFPIEVEAVKQVTIGPRFIPRSKILREEKEKLFQNPVLEKQYKLEEENKKLPTPLIDLLNKTVDLILQDLKNKPSKTITKYNVVNGRHRFINSILMGMKRIPVMIVENQ